MKIPIPFLGWIEEDDCNTNELEQERDFYKDEPERTDHASTKNNPPSSYQWQPDKLGSMEREGSKSPKDVKELKP